MVIVEVNNCKVSDYFKNITKVAYTDGIQVVSPAETMSS